MTKEERETAKNVINELKLYAEDLQYHSADEMKEAVDVAIRAFEQQPCEDCISREEVRQLICRNNDKYGYSDRFHEFTEECLKLPSVTPQPKVGKWIKTYEPNDAEPYILWMCSKCQNAERGRRRSKYCPNCGAKMEVE